jgi:hypothetical protein
MPAAKRKKKPGRILIVFDGESWFLRRVHAVEHDLDRDFKVYHCDEHLGGPFGSLGKAAAAAKKLGAR